MKEIFDGGRNCSLDLLESIDYKDLEEREVSQGGRHGSMHVHGVISQFMVPSNSQMKEPRHWFHEETPICLLRHWFHEGTSIYQIWSKMTFPFRGRQFV
jgi:hypothetical protein